MRDGVPIHGDAVGVDFPLQDQVYKVEDPWNPLTLRLDMVFLTPPCRGLGDTCDDLRFVDHLGRIGVVPFCDGASGTHAGPAHALPSAPCKHHQFKSVDGAASTSRSPCCRTTPRSSLRRAAAGTRRQGPVV